MVSTLSHHDFCTTEAPANQQTIDLMAGWSSRFPEVIGVQAGSAPLFEDPRAHWANEVLGGIRGKTVLELGPLEGGHTYILDRLGAKSITAIEANSRCFIRCLIAKELVGIPSASFLFGDFVPWLEAKQRAFDVVWCTGVLYHMVDPTRLLELVGRVANQLHIWTHYVPDGDFDNQAGWAQPIRRVEGRWVGGRMVEHFVRSYFTQPSTAQYCGGVYQEAAWLRRSDILSELARLGFDQVVIGHEDALHPHGPALSICATRTR